MGKEVNKKNATKSKEKRRYKKYAYELKRRIVYEIMRGELSREEAMLKYGIRSRQSINYWISQYSLLNYRPQKSYGMKESPQELIKKLQAEIELLKEDKIILNMVIDYADEEFKTDIRKKGLPQQLKRFKKHKGIQGGKK